MTAHPDGANAPVNSVVPAEARRYQGQRAGIVTRLVANTVDLIVVLVIVAFLYGGILGFLFLLQPSSFTFPSWLPVSVPLIGLIVVLPYLAFSWAATGRTYGDQLLGLRVISRSGRPLRTGQAILRAAFCVVFPIGVLWVAVSSSQKSVQDIVLRTSVVYDWTPNRPQPDGRTTEHAGPR
jgi:uncharacterized RDD family membrane protein YckC